MQWRLECHSRCNGAFRLYQMHHYVHDLTVQQFSPYIPWRIHYRVQALADAAAHAFCQTCPATVHGTTRGSSSTAHACKRTMGQRRCELYTAEMLSVTSGCIDILEPGAASQAPSASQARVLQDFISKKFTLLQHHGHLGLAGLALGLTLHPAYFPGRFETHAHVVTVWPPWRQA